MAPLAATIANSAPQLHGKQLHAFSAYHLVLVLVQALDLIAQELSGADEEEDPNTDISPAAVEPGHAELRAALLDCDYRKLGLGCLPDDVNRAHSSSIQGPLVLQVGRQAGWGVTAYHRCRTIAVLPDRARL